MIFPEPDRAFDPLRIRETVEAAGFSASRVEIDVTGTLQRLEGALALRVPGLHAPFFLEGGNAIEDLQALDEGTEVSISGTFRDDEDARDTARLVVEQVRR